MAPAGVLASGVMLSHLSTPESCLQKPRAQSSELKETLDRGRRPHTEFVFSCFQWGGCKHSAPHPTQFTVHPVHRDADTHEAGTPSHLWILGFGDDQELGPGRQPHGPHTTLETRDDRKSGTMFPELAHFCPNPSRSHNMSNVLHRSLTHSPPHPFSHMSTQKALTEHLLCT